MGVVRKKSRNIMLPIKEGHFQYTVINVLFNDILLSYPYTFDRQYKEQFLFYRKKVLKYDINKDIYKLSK